jgi:FlaG/FlaF family flagellin (archaellin)
MVAITVILASVVGTFVLSTTDKLSSPPPTSSFSFDQEQIDVLGGTTTAVTVIYEAGEDISEKNIELTVNGNGAFRRSGASKSDYLKLVWQPVEQYGRGYGGVPGVTWGEPDTVAVGSTVMITAKWTDYFGYKQEPSGAASNGFDRKWMLRSDHNGDVGIYDHGQQIYHPTGSRNMQPVDNARTLESGDTLRIIWTGSESGEVLAEYTVN